MGGLKIVKKQSQKRAIITILGASNLKSTYTLSDDLNENLRRLFTKIDEKKQYSNIFPFLCSSLSDSCEIIPIYTEVAINKNINIIEELDEKIKIKAKSYLENKNGKYINEKEINDIFAKINEILDCDEYKNSEFIIDVTHGFRHLPILAIVASIIKNFKDSKKIKHIIFGKVIIQPEQGVIGKFEIIDLKEYLDLANISFILTAFSDNYTVANHIEAPKFDKLINALRIFSNDIMALNISNLKNKSLENLKKELSKINDISVKKQAKNLELEIEKINEILKRKSEYEIAFELSKILFNKNYILLSLQLLFESIRSYMLETLIKKDTYKIMDKIKDECSREPEYEIREYAVKIYRNVSLDLLDELDENRIKNLISSNEKKTVIDFYDKVRKRRNSLSHTNSNNIAFKDIKDEISNFLCEYESLILSQRR